MEKLCDDITSEILIWLPAKNIAQLRCVCKRWNTLSREANFIKSHLRRWINNNDKDEILLVYNRGSPLKAHSSASPDIELINFIKFPVNFPSEKAQTKYINVIGSANGLICFSVRYYNDPVIHIWNPSLSALLTVPPYAISIPPHCPNAEYYFWFGFDPKNDDYKIVKFIRVRHSNHSVEWLQVEVYSMRSGCWKLITQSPPSRVTYFYSDAQVYVGGHDGHLHWRGFNDDLKIQTIVAFDLAAESFSEISLPDPINLDHDRLKLGVFGGKLCVISLVRGDCDCEVWVMDQYGSWVKNGFSHFHKDGMYHPYGFTLKNKFLYYEFCNEVIHLYDPAAPFNKVKPFQKNMVTKRYASDYRIIPYVESLVWVTPPTC
ncbi:F-box domain-containing protein [Artemisia annua]|uniref:F-box domain-containing protein n=1 Tax=Artemisia annua TaxID=35608 RepID=A0A2U1LA16_ARTAN|nr:F-box domain-containing protein [Artemisia annua]